MYLSLATKTGIGSIGSACFNRQNMIKQEFSAIILSIYCMRQKMSFLTGYRRICMFSSMTPSSCHLLCTAHAWVGLNAVRVSPWTARPSICCVLSTLKACKQQPDLVRAVFVWIKLYFVQVSNAAPRLKCYAAQRLTPQGLYHSDSIGMMHQACLVQISWLDMKVGLLGV